jgi:hypothetical protein
VDCEISHNIVVHGGGEHTWMAVDKKNYSKVMDLAQQKGVDIHQKSSFVPSAADLKQVFQLISITNQILGRYSSI